MWRTDPAASAAMLALDAGILPSNQDLQAVHFASSPMGDPAPFASELRSRNAVMLGHEVYTHNTEAADPDAIRGLVNAGSFFSPNVLEAECLLESLRAARDGDRFVAPLEEPGDIPRALEVATELSSIYGDQNLLLRQAIKQSLHARGPSSFHHPETSFIISCRRPIPSFHGSSWSSTRCRLITCLSEMGWRCCEKWLAHMKITVDDVVDVQVRKARRDSGWEGCGSRRCRGREGRRPCSSLHRRGPGLDRMRQHVPRGL